MYIPTKNILMSIDKDDSNMLGFSDCQYKFFTNLLFRPALPVLILQLQ